MYEHVERSTDPKRRRYFKITNGDPPSGDKLLRNKDRTDEDRKRPFEFKEAIDGIDWYWIHDGDGGPAARLAKRFLKRNGLVAFDKALGGDIRALRNDVAHNEPTPSLIAEAQTKMIGAELWSDENKFLTQKLVKDVLDELGVQQSDQLCNNLLSAARERLIAIT